ncbi:unnamed protein product, partial [Meganyctiphanes norvegica]
EWPGAHLSDLLRLGLLWKFGGWYTDSDTICLRSVMGFKNVISLGTSNKINSAVINFDKEHSFLRRCIDVISRRYNPKYYITAVGHMQEQTWRACNASVKTLNTLPDAVPNPCPDFSVLPQNIFFPYDWNNAFRPMVENSMNEEAASIFNLSYAIHFANGRTGVRAVGFGKNTMYEEAWRRYCPVTYHNLPKRDVVF